MIRCTITSLTLLLATTPSWSSAVEQKVRTISWNQLQPVIEFEDPFEKLAPNQLIDLGVLARVEDLEQRDDLGVLTDRKRQEAAEARARLQQQKIDIEGLLSRREEMNQLYRKRAAAAESSLDGQRIRIPGYLLPLTFSEAGVTEFLLVPWVGACIHTPPPPPNQMVHVVVPGGVEHTNRFVPIWVEGEIKPKPGTHRLFLIDGSRDIKVAYRMTTDRVTDYSALESDLLAEVEIPDSMNSALSWLQSWQAKTELLFTKAMTDIRDARSSAPMLWGGLVAFLYGVLHTLGPGHGKAVVAAYFVGERGSLWRGLRMGLQIAVFHVLSAVLVVVITDYAVRQATGQAPSDYRFVRLVSYGSIIAIGLWMLVKSLRAARKTRDHHHHHENCGCTHLAESTTGLVGLLSLAVGAVPCTGALLVLLFGMANDLLWPSVTLVVAISAGMALALTGVGIAAILGRRFLDHRTGGDEARQFRLARNLRVGAATGVLLIGTLLFTVTWYSNA